MADRVTRRVTKLGLEAKKDEDYSEWYTQVITKAELIEYYDVSGCYIIRPWAFAVWEKIQAYFDSEIKKLGVRNAYFPMFVSQAALEKEQTHLKDFSPEVAWVTKAGSSELAEHIAIRPTSETVIYPTFAKWVQSFRDLPIKVNQWCNVVRWEFKHPTPFIRSREFLWQEGHTAYATEKDATDEVYQILDLYENVYTDLMAIPVVKGRKSEKEKFAGADFTTTVEAYVAVNGRGIQGGTSHHLGQNFSKMFNIAFQDAETTGKQNFAYQNSWGLSTRTLGAMVMIHGDDRGLVLPPRVAAVQVIVMPVGLTAKTSDEDRKKLYEKVSEITKELVDGGVAAEKDDRDHVTPGWKFNHWELKGVPIRMEVGPRDLAENKVTAVLRFNKEKHSIPLNDLVPGVRDHLEQIHFGMYEKAKAIRDEHMAVCTDWKEFTARLDDKFILLSPFCGQPDCEEKIKAASTREEVGEQGQASMGAKTLCIPLVQPDQDLPKQCILPACKSEAKAFALFGRSY